MSFQGSVNSLLTLAGTAAALSPELEKKAEIRNLEKQEKVLQEQGDVAKLRGKDATDPDLLRNIGDISERQMQLAKKKFQLDPTEENFQAAVQKQKSYRSFNNYEALMIRQQEAINKTNGIIEAKKAQRRNFMEYLRKQPTDLGGTVGDLPINLQKQIASQFSKNARKKLMDKMDMEIKK